MLSALSTNSGYHIAVTTDHRPGLVSVDPGGSAPWRDLTINEARDLADMLYEAANEIADES